MPVLPIPVELYTPGWYIYQPYIVFHCSLFLSNPWSFRFLLFFYLKSKNVEHAKKIQFMHSFLIMFSPSVFYDTADLPVNVLTLIDQQFYSFVQERLGECQSELLKIQQINSVPCFLLTDDPCQVLNLNIDDNEVKLLKKQICFLLSDGSFVVKPGVKNGFKCLRDILTKKTEEKLKQTRSSKAQSAPSHSTDRSSSPALFSTPPPPVPNSSAAPTTPSNTSAPQLIAAPPAQGVAMASVMDHRKYFLNLLEQWCSDHQDEFMLGAFQLKEGSDFILSVSYDQNGILQANVKCNCNRRIVLSTKDTKIQLSNYQKHLRTSSCNHMKEMRKRFQEQQKLDCQQSSNNAMSSITVGLPITTQDVPNQSTASSSVNHSSTVNSSSADSVTGRASINSRKRSQVSSQSQSSQKAKRHRA